MKTTKKYAKFPLSLVVLLAMVLGFSACKNQKKMADMSSPQEDQTQIDEEEMTEEEIPDEEPVERVVVKEPSKETKLNNYFSAIASASKTTSANASIQEALTMFSNSEAPVLIVIYKDGSKPSYDEPTTIVKYLNYLKDTKNNKAKVEEVVYDTNGKIKELVLRK
ncbi:nucleoid-structuring protein H-NS [Ekhidna sp.]|uniref:nucleoid-structuring protein H-NS n=1 Tax=Ekhidna sp. TaxID=2608089 RepID=UPI003B514388